MKIVRLASLVGAAVMVVSLLSVAAAFAETEFHPTGATFTSVTGTSKLVAGSNEVICRKSSAGGTVASSTLAGPFLIHFLECTSTSNKLTFCNVRSTNTTNEGLILTQTLHGILGLILPSAGTGRALLLLPTSGKVIATLLVNACTEETSVTGSVAGEVSPIKSLQKTSKLTFALSGGEKKQAIRNFDPATGGGEMQPTLNAFGLATATLETTSEITFNASTEVT